MARIVQCRELKNLTIQRAFKATSTLWVSFHFLASGENTCTSSMQWRSPPAIKLCLLGWPPTSPCAILVANVMRYIGDPSRPLLNDKANTRRLCSLVKQSHSRRPPKHADWRDGRWRTISKRRSSGDGVIQLHGIAPPKKKTWL